MSFSDEDIFAFLLGEADEALNQRIRESLRSDPDLVARVSHLRSVLNVSDASGECFEPPSGLVESTIQRVEGHRHARGKSSQNSDWERSEPRLRQPSLSPSSTGFWSNSLQGHRWMDSIVLTISIVALCCLFLPSIVSIRFESRRIQCANNLRLNGRALIEYAGRCPQSRFPAIAVSGPEAFSGVFSVRLHQIGLLQSTGQLRCVSVQRLGGPTMVNLSNIPTMEQLHTMRRDQLVHWQKVLGGDYAYNLGIVEGQRLVAPRNQGRRHFAILADAPVFVHRVRMFEAHEGRGANIVFDDGHVEFVSRKFFESDVRASEIDEPFCNRNGENEAGLDNSDASLAPSYFPPLGR